MPKVFAGVATVSLTAAILAAAPAVTPAHADHPNTVCSYTGDGGEILVHADWISGRSFRVAVTDLRLFAAADAAGESFVPLPMDPDLRLSANRIAVGQGLEISDVTISQGVTLDVGADPTATHVAHYERLAPAPWESVSGDGRVLSWAQDLGARSSADGAQTTPQELAGAVRAASAGVLDFTVTVPADRSGDIALVEQITATFTEASYSSESQSWRPGQERSVSAPGCTVTVEAASQDGPGDNGTGTDGTSDTGGTSDSDASEGSGDSADPSPLERPGGSDTHDGARSPAARTPQSPSNDGGAASDTARKQVDPAESGSDPTLPGGQSADEVSETGGLSKLPWILGAGVAAICGMALISGSRQRT